MSDINLPPPQSITYLLIMKTFSINIQLLRFITMPKLPISGEISKPPIYYTPPTIRDGRVYTFQFTYYEDND